MQSYRGAYVSEHVDPYSYQQQQQRQRGQVRAPSQLYPSPSSLSSTTRTTSSFAAAAAAATYSIPSTRCSSPRSSSSQLQQQPQQQSPYPYQEQQQRYDPHRGGGGGGGRGGGDYYANQENSARATSAAAALNGSRRVLINDVASVLGGDAQLRSTYRRDASPPLRSPTLRVSNPPGGGGGDGYGGGIGSGGGGALTSPLSLASNSNINNNASGEGVRPSGGRAHSPARAPRDHHSPLSSTLSIPTFDRSGGIGDGLSAPPSSSSSARSGGGGGSVVIVASGASPSLSPSTATTADSSNIIHTGGSGTTPPAVVDLFSATETHNYREPNGPFARAAATLRAATYVAQSAYTQRNPFRTQTFADFAAHPIYDAPENLPLYPEALAEMGAAPGLTGRGAVLSGAGIFGGGIATEVALSGGRAVLGEFLVHRLADLAKPMSTEERDGIISLLNDTLEILQTGEWFYKWTRTGTVHRRFFWLNLQRGTLAWAASPKQSLIWNTEIKIAQITSVSPDSIRDARTGRNFYRMLVTTATKVLCIATERREKFDCWFRALQQLTLPNLVNGVPGLWGRPTSVINNGRHGAVGRWVSRYSPLQEISDGNAAGVGDGDLRITANILSSD